jgi:hypothetical protein
MPSNNIGKMPNEVITTFIIMVAAVLIGIILFSFVSGVILPQENFTYAKDFASNLASQTTLSIGPLINNSFVLEVYNPAYSSNFTVFVFIVPSYYIPSIGLVTPQVYTNQNPFTVILSNGKVASKTFVNKVYDVSGNSLYSSINGYSIPSNSPVTIIVSVQKGQVAVVWVMVQNSNYWFRIGYTYTGGQ